MAHDLASGEEVWSDTLTPAGSTGSATSPPVVGGDEVWPGYEAFTPAGTCLDALVRLDLDLDTGDVVAEDQAFVPGQAGRRLRRRPVRRRPLRHRVVGVARGPGDVVGHPVVGSWTGGAAVATAFAPAGQPSTFGCVAAPEYVPQPPNRAVRAYESPPRRPESWRADRPGDLPLDQPRGERLGSQGPDQGYIYVLARRFEGKLQLASDEHESDAIAGCIGVALKRASLFGRAPVLHDLTAALTVWGFLGDAPPDLIAFRQPLFEEVANPHHYPEQRKVVDLVPEDVLRRAPEALAEAHRRDWRSLLAV